jgi:hypothetical protein
MSRRVQFGRYGPTDVFRIVDVSRPSAEDGQGAVTAEQGRRASVIRRKHLQCKEQT